MSVIVPFLDQQTFFMTGATGLLGKVTLLKILYHCPNARIYILIRKKKDLSPRERFEKEIIRESPIYEDFLRDHPDAMNNVIIVNGDISEERLGLSDEDYDQIQSNVTCILHIAATVQFNEPLEVAFSINVLGSRRVLKLAKTSPNLISYVHVSTAYVNAIRITSDDIKEKIYPIDYDIYHIIDYVLSTDPADLAKETPRIIGDHPNTYTFSKCITEHMLLEEKEEVPLCIIRPSMITGSRSFPVAGWVDSFIGPAGLMLANGLGVMHAIIGDKHGKPDFFPVDYTVNMILVATWNNATNPPLKRLPIYHACCGKDNILTWYHIGSLSAGYFKRNPAKKSQNGYPFLIYYKHTLPFVLTHYLTHVFPALIMDSKRVFKGKKAKMYRASKTLYKTCLSLAFFIKNQFSFSIKNTLALFEGLNEEDSKIFDFDIRTIDWEIYLLQFTQGLKYYLLRETAYDNASVVHKL